jgi:hypothetical protein
MKSYSYSVSPRRRLVLLSLELFFLSLPALIAVGGVASKDRNMLIAAAVLSCIMLPFVAFFAWIGKRVWLRIDSSGVTVSGVIGFTKQFHPWEDISALIATRGAEGLILSAPNEDRAYRNWSDWAGVRYQGVAQYSGEQLRLIGECRFVPIVPFGYWFDRGDLIEAFRSFKPELLEGLAAERAKPATSPRERRIIIIVSGSVGITVAVTALFALYSHQIPADYNQPLTLVGDQLLRVLSALGALGLCCYTAVNLAASGRYLRLKRYGLALLWTAMAIVQLLLAVLLAAGAFSEG